MKPRLRDVVAILSDDDGREYIVAQVKRGLPHPYYLDDQDESNPALTGPYSADELIVVLRRENRA